jgi:hypothetical protein
MAEQKVQWGIMGTAGIASKNVVSMQVAPNAECAAIASRSIEKAQVRSQTICEAARVRIQASHCFFVFFTRRSRERTSCRPGDFPTVRHPQPSCLRKKSLPPLPPRSRTTYAKEVCAPSLPLF